jgi:ABC-2 type transport system ATP-binding protein
MIAVEGLQKVIGSRTVLAVERLEVTAGQVAGVIGPPDSGKTTLIRLLSGQIPPTAGSVCITGHDVMRGREAAQAALGVLFAESALYERSSVRDNLTFHARLRRLPKGRVDEVLSRIGLIDQARKHVKELPTGLQRRLAFGRAILHRPAVLLLDEPFAGTDPESVRLLSRLIGEEAAGGTAVLIASDDAAGLARLCTLIHELEDGRIVGSYVPGERTQDNLPFKIPARQEGLVALFSPPEILYAYSRGGKTILHTVRGEAPTRLTLNELEVRLRHGGFFRAHRAYLVNLQHVKAVIPYTRDSFTLVLSDSDESEIPLSKSAARELREFLGY